MLQTSLSSKCCHPGKDLDTQRLLECFGNKCILENCPKAPILSIADFLVKLIDGGQKSIQWWSKCIRMKHIKTIDSNPEGPGMYGFNAMVKLAYPDFWHALSGLELPTTGKEAWLISKVTNHDSFCFIWSAVVRFLYFN